MATENDLPVSLVDVGQKLVGHSKTAEFTARHGLVVELFPFIIEASERMSARAISRFLQEEQQMKLSQVTITRALNDPQKNWLSYFAGFEKEAITLAKWAKSRSFNYLFLSKAEFDSKMSFEQKGVVERAVSRGAVALLRPDCVAAINVLRAKWFSIGLATRLKAKPYLERHLIELADKF